MTGPGHGPGEASKTARDENFPVGSWLLPRRIRPHVALFYAVVRGADDIADSPALAPGEKIARLDAVDAALCGKIGAPDYPAVCASLCEKAARLRAALDGIGVSVAPARDLLRAFRQDATKTRYADWDELLDYCRYSANPVGRFLLALHGEGTASHAPSDALCAALQILNHLQDCGDDYRALDRVYLPEAFFAEAGAAIEALAEGAADVALRRVLDRTLDGVDGLLARARSLPGRIRHPGMRREAAVIVALAERLAAELRRRDPLAERVELGKPQKLACLVRGLLRARRRPRVDAGLDGGADAEAEAAAAVHALVHRSGSSFYGAMRLLPREKREAMFAVYAFCRAVDDIADGPGTPEARAAALAGWRNEINALYAGRPERPLTRALAGAVARFGLRRGDFEAVIDGVSMDAAPGMVAPDFARLERYCARVAGAVGLLSVRVFGCTDPRADDYALALGHALQLTNILRDVAEDAEDGRLYLPAELLDAAGIETREPRAVVAHPALAEACAALAEIALKRFDEARATLATLPAADRAALRPAVAMMAVYRRLLDRLMRRGWRRIEAPVAVPRAEKVWLVLRHCMR